MFNLGVRANRWLIAAVAWELCLLGVIVYVPALQGPFNTYPLDGIDWVVSVSAAATLIIVAEIYKAAYRSSTSPRSIC